MEYKEMTATEAVKHFARNGFKKLWPKNRSSKNPDFKRADKMVRDAERGHISDSRAKSLLEQYGGERYKVATTFQVAITEPNI